MESNSDDVSSDDLDDDGVPLNKVELQNPKVIRP
jgi:hypothetical protein